jgi:Zn-dependent protease
VGDAAFAPVLIQFAFFMVLINLLLMFFNLIPIPPLDGSRVLSYFLPPAGQEALDRIGIFGIFLVLILFRYVLWAPFTFLIELVYKLTFLGL